jgi:hypothetical protein
MTMMLFISFSAFSQTDIQWTGIVDGDMSKADNWLTVDGTQTISPTSNNLIINNTSSFEIDFSASTNINIYAIRIILNAIISGEITISNGVMRGTTPIINEPELSTSLNANSLKINNDNGVTIASNGRLTVNADLINNTKMLIESNTTGTGSLIVKGNINGSSTDFKIERWINASNEDSKWHLLSSPVSNAKSGVLEGHFLNYYVQSTGDFKAIRSLNYNLEVAEGYAAKLDFSTTDGVTNKTNPIVFENNTPNSGTITKDLEVGVGNTYFNLPGNLNLVGNPYTSYLNWDLMWNDPANNGVVNPTIYYYSEAVGSTNGTAGGWHQYNANNQIGDGEIISIEQGFCVLLTDNTPNATGILTFKSDFQTHTSNVFHKKSKDFKNYFELNTESNSLSDKIYFRFNENTSDAFDPNYDAYKLKSFGETPTPFFMSRDNKRLAICEMPQAESIDLGFLMDVDGEVTFSLSNVQDFDEIILEDKVINSFTDLTKTSYTFDHSSEESETGRFTIHFKKGTLNEVQKEIGMKVYSSSNNIFIQSNRPLTNAIVSLYNTSGQLVFSKKYSSLNNEQLATDLSNGIYIIEISSNENRYSSKINIKL